MIEDRNKSIVEIDDAAVTEEIYSRTNRFLPQYFQIDIADSIGKYDALGRDYLNLGLLHYALLNFCVYGPGQSKKGPFDAGTLWDEAHDSFPAARNEDYLRDIFIEACQEYQSRVFNAHNKYLEVKAANEKGGRHSAEKRRTAAANKAVNDDKATSGTPSADKTEPDADAVQKVEKAQYSPISIDEARRFLLDIRDNGINSKYIEKYKIPWAVYSLLDIDDNTKLIEGDSYFSKDVNIRGSIPILSELEQRYILLLRFSGPWIHMLNYYLDYEGFHCKISENIGVKPMLPYIVWMVCDSIDKDGGELTADMVKNHMKAIIDKAVRKTGNSKYIECRLTKGLFERHGYLE